MDFSLGGKGLLRNIRDIMGDRSKSPIICVNID